MSLFDSAYRAPLVAGIGLVVLQQITGQPSVLSYSTAIFRDAGLSDYAAVLVAAFKLVAVTDQRGPLRHCLVLLLLGSGSRSALLYVRWPH